MPLLDEIYGYECEHPGCRAWRGGVSRETIPDEWIDCHKCGNLTMHRHLVSRRDPSIARNWDQPKTLWAVGPNAKCRNESEAKRMMEKHKIWSHPADDSGVKSPLGTAPETPASKQPAMERVKERLKRKGL